MTGKSTDEQAAVSSIQDFKLMTIDALRVHLGLRKKSTDGDFDTLVSRYV